MLTEFLAAKVVLMKSARLDCQHFVLNTTKIEGYKMLLSGTAFKENNPLSGAAQVYHLRYNIITNVLFLFIFSFYSLDITDYFTVTSAHVATGKDLQVFVHFVSLHFFQQIIMIHPVQTLFLLAQYWLISTEIMICHIMLNKACKENQLTGGFLLQHQLPRIKRFTSNEVKEKTFIVLLNKITKGGTWRYKKSKVLTAEKGDSCCNRKLQTYLYSIQYSKHLVRLQTHTLLFLIKMFQSPWVSWRTTTWMRSWLI